MKRETLLNHMFQHGRLTAYNMIGERQVVWGVIADVNCDTMKVLNHEAEFQKFEMKNIKGFRHERFDPRRKYPVLKCDCGCKEDLRFICEKCGKSFCGVTHGAIIRDFHGVVFDLCDSCTSVLKAEKGP